MPWRHMTHRSLWVVLLGHCRSQGKGKHGSEGFCTWVAHVTPTPIPWTPKPNCRVDEVGGQEWPSWTERRLYGEQTFGAVIMATPSPVSTILWFMLKTLSPWIDRDQNQLLRLLYFRGCSLLETLQLNWTWNEYFTCGRGGRNILKATRTRPLRSSRLICGSVVVQPILFRTPHGVSQSE